MNDSGQGKSTNPEQSSIYQPARAITKSQAKTAGEGKRHRFFAGGGKVQKWVVGKPKFVGTLPDDPTSPRIEKLNVPAVVFRLVLLAVGVTIVVGAAMWVILGITILPTVQAGDAYYTTDRTAWTEGEAPVGALATALDAPVERTIWSRLVMLVNSDPNNQNSIVKVTGRDTLGNYLVTCYAGACLTSTPPPAVFTVPVVNVLGKPTGKIWFFGTEKL